MTLKILKVADVRKPINLMMKEKISYSRMVEMLNEIIAKKHLQNTTDAEATFNAAREIDYRYKNEPFMFESFDDYMTFLCGGKEN